MHNLELTNTSLRYVENRVVLSTEAIDVILLIESYTNHLKDYLYSVI